MFIVKTCSKCKTSKDVSKFSKDKNRKDGLDPACKDCHSDYQKKRYSEPSYKKRKAKQHRSYVNRNRDYVYSVLQQSKCVDCNDSRWQVLEFDHVRGKKRRGICDMIRFGCSILTIQKEIDKCEVRCANCHRLKTAKQLGWFKAIN